MITGGGIYIPITARLWWSDLQKWQVMVLLGEERNQRLWHRLVEDVQPLKVNAYYHEWTSINHIDSWLSSQLAFKSVNIQKVQANCVTLDRQAIADRRWLQKVAAGLRQHSSSANAGLYFKSKRKYSKGAIITAWSLINMVALVAFVRIRVKSHCWYDWWRWRFY